VVILRRFLINSVVGRFVGPYHRRIPLALAKSARLLIAYTNECRLYAGTQIFAKSVVRGLSESDAAPVDMAAMTEKIAGRFPHGNISVAVDHIAAQAAVGRLCIATLQDLDVADWRRSYATFFRRVFASGLGMNLGQTNADLDRASQVLIDMESLRYADPAIFETWDRQRRRFLAGLIVGDAIAEDFLGQLRTGIKKPKPTTEINTLFSEYVMFDSAETATKGATLPLKAQPSSPPNDPNLATVTPRSLPA
jgi:hypothetical protein